MNYDRASARHGPQDIRGDFLGHKGGFPGLEDRGPHHARQPPLPEGPHRPRHRRLRPQELHGGGALDNHSGPRPRAGGDNVVVIARPRGSLERTKEGPMGTLSEREAEVVVLAGPGLSNYRKAMHLLLAEATVKRHLANVYQKMVVSSRGEAARKALQDEWITIEEVTELDPGESSPPPTRD